jgi:hypothetical protein
MQTIRLELAVLLSLTLYANIRPPHLPTVCVIRDLRLYSGQCRQLHCLRPHGPLLHPLAHLRQLDRCQEDPHCRHPGLDRVQRRFVPEQSLRHRMVRSSRGGHLRSERRLVLGSRRSHCAVLPRARKARSLPCSVAGFQEQRTGGGPFIR